MLIHVFFLAQEITSVCKFDSSVGPTEIISAFAGTEDTTNFTNFIEKTRV